VKSEEFGHLFCEKSSIQVEIIWVKASDSMDLEEIGVNVYENQ
jgi:hypothetical protein